MKPTAQPVQPSSATREALLDIVNEQLVGLYYCGRVWNAWNVGTMSQDDFTPAEETEFAENIVSAIEAAQPVQPALWQPLVTAPRDTEILLWVNVDVGPPLVVQGFWCSNENLGEAGWIDNNGKSWPVTHWMPLPAPPTPAQPTRDPLNRMEVPNAQNYSSGELDELVEVAQPVQPAGWKLVPIESTPEMIAAGQRFTDTYYSNEDDFLQGYKAALAAAPARTNP